MSVKSEEIPIKIREVNSQMVGKMFVVSGIIISTTKPYIKASKLKIQCKSCQTTKTIVIEPGQNPYVPAYCEEGARMGHKCPQDPYVALPDSEVIDAQSLKIQESPEDVPTGEIARTYRLMCDRNHVSKCVPGDRVSITGIMLVHDVKTENLSKGHLYVCGIEKLKERTWMHFTEQE